MIFLTASISIVELFKKNCHTGTAVSFLLFLYSYPSETVHITSFQDMHAPTFHIQHGPPNPSSMFTRVHVLRMTIYALKQRSINAHIVPKTNIGVVSNSTVSLTGYRGC